MIRETSHNSLSVGWIGQSHDAVPVEAVHHSSDLTKGGRFHRNGKQLRPEYANPDVAVSDGVDHALNRSADYAQRRPELSSISDHDQNAFARYDSFHASYAG